MEWGLHLAAAKTCQMVPTKKLWIMATLLWDRKAFIIVDFTQRHYDKCYYQTKFWRNWEGPSRTKFEEFLPLPSIFIMTVHHDSDSKNVNVSGWEALYYPLYSLDLSPSNYHCLFPNMKKMVLVMVLYIQWKVEYHPY